MLLAEPLGGGFADPVLGTQALFRAALDAMARPCRPVPVAADIAPPAPLGRVAAGLLLALADADTPILLDHPGTASEAARRWLQFHTGAPVAPTPGQAAFAFLADPALIAPLDRFAAGDAEYPDRSATLIVQMAATGAASDWEAAGPGIDGRRILTLRGLPDRFEAVWAGNGRRYPLGVDIFFALDDALVGLPRTTRLRPAGDGERPCT